MLNITGLLFVNPILVCCLLKESYYQTMGQTHGTDRPCHAGGRRQAAVGMYGDLQGIAGKTLQEIERLDLLALDAPKNEK